MKPIEFWFDFASPYAYFATFGIEDVAARHGRTVLWRPFLLGAVFEVTGMQTFDRTPLRGDYAHRDWARLARRMNVPFVPPSGPPALTVAPGETCPLAGTGTPRSRHPVRQGGFRGAFRCRLGHRQYRGDARHRGILRNRAHGPGSGPALCEAEEPVPQEDRRGHHARHLRLTLLHRRRRAVLGCRPSADDRRVADPRRLVIPIPPPGIGRPWREHRAAACPAAPAVSVLSPQVMHQIIFAPQLRNYTQIYFQLYFYCH
jgi:hypothetical protein